MIALVSKYQSRGNKIKGMDKKRNTPMTNSTVNIIDAALAATFPSSWGTSPSEGNRMRSVKNAREKKILWRKPHEKLRYADKPLNSRCTKGKKLEKGAAGPQGVPMATKEEKEVKRELLTILGDHESWNLAKQSLSETPPYAKKFLLEKSRYAENYH